MSTTTTMDNFTVQSADYIVNGGTNITDTVGGTVIMTFVPNVGFAIDALNFSAIPVSYTHLTLPTILRV